MKKLAYGDGYVYVGLTPEEFLRLADKAYSNVPDGTNISLTGVKQKLDLVDTKKPQLSELKTALVKMVQKLTQIGV